MGQDNKASSEDDPKNPLGLKVDSKKPIPVRRPPPKDSKIAHPSSDIDPEREEKLRKDRLESAKRYEAMRLYEDAVKYYKMANAEDEACRVQQIMEDLYLKKAQEFEVQHRMDEAAHLYDILKMRDDASRCRGKSTVPTVPELDPLDTDVDAVKVFKPMNNPDMALTNPETSPYISAGQEQVAKELPVRKPKEEDKVFTFCPYCGEEMSLPKQPKYCPFCREPFS